MPFLLIYIFIECDKTEQQSKSWTMENNVFFYYLSHYCDMSLRFGSPVVELKEM
jgi:hypothetical protein